MTEIEGTRLADYQDLSEMEFGGEGDSGYSHNHELWLTPTGPQEVERTFYHPEGAPNYPSLQNKTVSDIKPLGLRDLVRRFNLSPEQAGKLRGNFQN